MLNVRVIIISISIQSEAMHCLSAAWRRPSSPATTSSRLFNATTMSFAKVLSPAIREIRILCCQTGAASAGTRSVEPIQSLVPWLIQPIWAVQAIHFVDIPNTQAAQSRLANTDSGGPGYTSAGVCEVWYVACPPTLQFELMSMLAERGVEKHVEVENLSQNDVASKVAQLLSLS